MINDAEERANVLNAIEDAVESLGYCVAGYDDTDESFFQVLIDKNPWGSEQARK